MHSSLTLSTPFWRRALAFFAGLGMMVASFMTIQHFFSANYPETIWEGSFCDVSAFFNCDSSAFSTISEVGGVPIGFFGMLIGALACLGLIFPSARFERTNQSIALFNIIGVLLLLAYSIFVLGTICLLCSGYYLSSGIHFFLFWRYGIDRETRNWSKRYLHPSFKILATFAVVALTGASGVIQYHQVRKEAQTGGVASQIVAQFFELPIVPLPSTVSPFWTAKSTEQFEDAPIRVVEYGDLLCSDCLVLNRQLTRLKEEFKGKINIAYQLFPLEGKCNDIVEKDLHAGACELSLMAAYDSSKFKAIHDEVYDNFQAAKTPEWREALAKRYGVEAALSDSTTHKLLQTLIRTGAEYEKTSEKYSYGIRSTPTMIINNRLIIGTFPDAQMRAIFQALLDQNEQTRGARFIENWVD